jgi:hypothetical protein
MTYIELLLLRLWISFELASRVLGAMISCPSVLRKVVENSPNSLTKRGCLLTNPFEQASINELWQIYLVIDENEIANLHRI